MDIDLHLLTKVGVIRVKERLEEMGARDELLRSGLWGGIGKGF